MPLWFQTSMKRWGFRWFRDPCESIVTGGMFVRKKKQHVDTIVFVLYFLSVCFRFCFARSVSCLRCR